MSTIEVQPDDSPEGVIIADGRFISAIWQATWNGGNLVGCLSRESNQWRLRYRFKYDKGARSAWVAAFDPNIPEAQARMLSHDALAEALRMHKGVQITTHEIREFVPDRIKAKLRAAGVQL